MNDTEKISAEDMQFAAACTQQAIDLFFRGEYDRSLLLLERALTLNPAQVRAYCGKALCFAQLGQAAKALEFAEKALALDDRAGIAFTTRALCRHRLGDHDGAFADYERALELAPDDYRVYYNYACYCAERGREERCRELLTAALAMSPASFADVAAVDPDLARFSGAEWFRELIATMKRRGIRGAPHLGTE